MSFTGSGSSGQLGTTSTAQATNPGAGTAAAAGSLAPPKPVTMDDGRALPAGTVLTESDTGARWVWDGGAWHFAGLADRSINDLALLLAAKFDALMGQLAAEFAALKLTYVSGYAVDTADPAQS